VGIESFFTGVTRPERGANHLHPPIRLHSVVLN